MTRVAINCFRTFLCVVKSLERAGYRYFIYILTLRNQLVLRVAEIDNKDLCRNPSRLRLLCVYFLRKLHLNLQGRCMDVVYGKHDRHVNKGLSLETHRTATPWNITQFNINHILCTKIFDNSWCARDFIHVCVS